jgi:predicted O-methyltransferase YrrM
VLSIDTDAAAQDHARRSVTEVGLVERVGFRVDDGGRALAGLPDGGVDLLFLDAERTEYPSWWPHPVRVLRPGGVLVIDNALSHPGEIAPVRDLLERDGRLAVTTIAVGKGELVALRR